ncbi:MAG: DNA polymerase III subunit epsilon [Gammaproteobacteria bacterium]
MARQVILDTETTGLKPEDGHRIIEIGCVEMINRKITGNYFHHYFNPERTIDQGALRVHGISNDFLHDKPLFKELLDDLLNFIQDSELIIHNAPFDVGFLEYEFKLTKRDLKKISDYCNVTDTLAMARRMHPGQRNSLDALCKRYQIDNSQRQLHGALLDAEILANLYLAMTGGQANLFDDFDKQNAFDSANSTLTVSREGLESLFIQKSTQDELNAHQDYLKFLQEKAGQHYWEEE